MSEPTYKRPITVTVSSEGRDAGKTTLIALIAHALRGSGHRTMVPPDSAGLLHNYRLDELFDVTFVEALGSVYTARQIEDEISRRIEAMRKSYEAALATLTQDVAKLRAGEAAASLDAQQARNALAEAAIIITGLHQDLRTKKA